MVPKGAFVDVGIVVEMDLVASGGGKGMAVVEWDCCKGQPFGGIGVIGKIFGEIVGRRWKSNAIGLEIVVTQRVCKFVEWHAGVGFDVLVIDVESGLDNFGKNAQNCGLLGM